MFRGTVLHIISMISILRSRLSNNLIDDQRNDDFRDIRLFVKITTLNQEERRKGREGGG